MFVYRKNAHSYERNSKSKQEKKLRQINFLPIPTEIEISILLIVRQAFRNFFFKAVNADRDGESKSQTNIFIKLSNKSKQNLLWALAPGAGIPDLGWGNPEGLEILDGAFNPEGLGGAAICKWNRICGILRWINIREN